MSLLPPADAVIAILIGHMLGDYIFQNNWMALSKNRDTFRCWIHCLVYTLCVCLCTVWHPSLMKASSPAFAAWPLVVFASHFPIDRWSLGERWLKLIRGRSIEQFIRHGHEDLDLSEEATPDQCANYIAARAGFTTLVFAAVDNTLHIVLMFVGWRLLFGGVP